MSPEQEKILKSWLEKLKNKNIQLKERIKYLSSENREFKKNLVSTNKLLHEMPNPIILIQNDTVILVNKQFQALLGYSENDLNTSGMFKPIHADSLEFAKRIYDDLKAGKPAPDQFELFFNSKTGKPLCCEVRGKKILYKGRKAFLFSFMNIDERQQMELKNSLAHKMDALSRMASGIHREGNHLFRLFDNHSKYLHKLSLESNHILMKSFEDINIVAERGKIIFKHLEILAKKHNDVSKKTPCDFNGIIEDAIANTRIWWDLQKKNGVPHIVLKKFLKPTAPIDACPEEIKMVIINMISNAVEALPQGGEILISSYESSGFAHFIIQDNGMGITKKNKNKVFDPFFTTKGEARLGLGLSLAQSIIENHGGSVSLMSEKGNGSFFMIKIPVSKQKVIMHKNGKNRIKNAKIMIIADEGIIKEIIIKAFQRKGGSVYAASTGSDVLKLLKKNKFHLVIADLYAINLSYSKIIPNIREINGHYPIIMINGDNNGLHDYENLGADYILEKPVDFDKIVKFSSTAMSLKDHSP